VLTELRVLGRGKVLAALALTTVGSSAMFTVFTYITPILRDATHASLGFITAMLVTYGLGLTVGNWLGGKFADRSVDRTLMVALAALTVILVGFALLMPFAVPTALIVFLWGVASFALVAPLQVRVMTAAADAPHLASSVNIGAFNMGNALGAALGGAVISLGLGYPVIALAGATTSALGLIGLLASPGKSSPSGAGLTALTRKALIANGAPAPVRPRPLLARDRRGDGQIAHHVDHRAGHVEQPVDPDHQPDPFGRQPGQRENHRHRGQGARRNPDGAHARQHRHGQHHPLLAERQIHPEELRDEQHRDGGIDRRPALVGNRPHPQHQSRHARGQMQVVFGGPQGAGQGEVGRGRAEGDHRRFLHPAQEGQRHDPAAHPHHRKEREHDLKQQRGDHHRDIGAQIEQQVPAEQQRQVEHEAGHRQRSHPPDLHQNAHPRVEHPLAGGQNLPAAPRAHDRQRQPGHHRDHDQRQDRPFDQARKPA
jgi:hypothetical protein